MLLSTSWKVPFSIIKSLNHKLEELEKLDFIEAFPQSVYINSNIYQKRDEEPEVKIASAGLRQYSDPT